jgi:hypothetical protein
MVQDNNYGVVGNQFVYSGILNAQSVNEYVRYLEAGGYTNANGIAEYKASLPIMIQKVIAEHPEVI